MTLQSENGKIFTTHYDRLVGADGARSQVRKAMETEAEMHCQESVVPDVYKTLFVCGVSQDQTVELAADRIHT